MDFWVLDSVRYHLRQIHPVVQWEMEKICSPQSEELRNGEVNWAAEYFVAVVVPLPEHSKLLRI